MKERLFWLGFSLFPGVGPLRFQKLLSYFGTAKDAWHAAKEELLASGLGALTESFVRFRDTTDLATYEREMRDKGVTYLTLQDSAYPQQLAQITNPPFVLYVKAFRAIDFNDPKLQNTVGIVGTRKITEYGRQVTEQFTQDLVDAGCVIVSGLALGVDGVAHKKTVDLGGMTIAVLGCGVDCCTPREHMQLYAEILQKQGVIVSEFPLGHPPSKGSFPSRNRIVAGLSRGVLVTEGAEDSGSLITAADALKQGRDVFAVPGPITSSLSKGPNSLIAKGAKMVMSAEDILHVLGLQGHKGDKGDRRDKPVSGDTPEEQEIIDLLAQQELHFDELVRKTGKSASELSSMLSLMEMKGMIHSQETGVFCLS